MKKFVSFIAPVYNVNKYLVDFFESFRGVPRDLFEIVIVNDNSPEDPTPIIKEYSFFFNIKYIKNTVNMGVGFARNIAINNMSKKSTNFMIVDSDDELAEGAWEQIQKADIDKITLSSKFLIFDSKKSYECKVWRNGFYKGCGINATWGHLFPADLKIVPFSSASFEDQKWMAANTIDREFDYFEKPIINYRRRASSILNTENNSEKKAIQVREFVLEMKRSEELDLILKNYKYWWSKTFTFTEYKSISKKKRVDIDNSFFSNGQKLLGSFFGLLVFATFFWKIYKKVFQRNFYK